MDFVRAETFDVDTWNANYDLSMVRVPCNPAAAGIIAPVASDATVHVPGVDKPLVSEAVVDKPLVSETNAKHLYEYPPSLQRALTHNPAAAATAHVHAAPAAPVHVPDDSSDFMHRYKTPVHSSVQRVEHDPANLWPDATDHVPDDLRRCRTI